MQHTVYLGLGSNIGDRQQYIYLAVSNINRLFGDVVRQSACYQTEPWGFESDNAFLNAVVMVKTECSPREVLRWTQYIERLLGRREKSKDGIYHDRTIDIDILLYDDLTINEPDLVIPHPLMYDRDFVMTPLREIL